MIYAYAHSGLWHLARSFGTCVPVPTNACNLRWCVRPNFTDKYLTHLFDARHAHVVRVQESDNRSNTRAHIWSTTHINAVSGVCCTRAPLMRIVHNFRDIFGSAINSIQTVRDVPCGCELYGYQQREVRKNYAHPSSHTFYTRLTAESVPGY